MDEPSPSPPDDTHADELAPFEALCRRLGGFDDRIAPEWADGYLTALAVLPAPPPLTEIVLGMAGEAFERCCADPADAEQALSTLAAHWQAIRDALDPATLDADPGALRLHPLMMVWDDDARKDLVEAGDIGADDAAGLLTGADWSDGFADAVREFTSHWSASGAGRRVQQDIDALLEPVELLAEREDSPRLAAYVRRAWRGRMPSRDTLIDGAVFAVQELRLLWLEQAARPAPRVAEATPGRNDPCPCGSGRKFKKCHGATA